MLKKIFLGLFIICMLLVLSYLKTMREDEGKAASYKEGQLESEKLIEDYKQDIDSLTGTLGEKELEFAESNLEKDKEYQSQIDSINQLVEDQGEEINTLREKVISSQQTTEKKSTSKKTLSKHEKIYQYYKSRYAALPGDLSSYEKKIAVKEIREETAQKFSVTLSELEQVRKEYNLKY